MALLILIILYAVTIPILEKQSSKDCNLLIKQYVGAFSINVIGPLKYNSIVNNYRVGDTVFTFLRFEIFSKIPATPYESIIENVELSKSMVNLRLKTIETINYKTPYANPIDSSKIVTTKYYIDKIESINHK